MQINPAEEWQQLTEHYREMFDGQLEDLAQDMDDLTETARAVLRNELKNRGLTIPGEESTGIAKTAGSQSRFTSTIGPDFHAGEPDASTGDNENESSKEFTWKTPLCECEDEQNALQLREVLKRAGVESWIERPGSVWDTGGLRVVVAADQLEHAQVIATQPIPQEIVDLFTTDAPVYEAPTCPKCGAEDPVLESAEPANSWLCEVCGAQWTEPDQA